MGNAGICVLGIPERMFWRMAEFDPPQRQSPVVRSGPRPPFAFPPWQDVHDFWNNLWPAETSAPAGCCESSRGAEKISKQAVRRMPMPRLYCMHEAFVGVVSRGVRLRSRGGLSHD